MEQIQTSPDHREPCLLSIRRMGVMAESCLLSPDVVHVAQPQTGMYLIFEKSKTPFLC